MNLRAAFQHLCWGYLEDRSRLSTAVHSRRTRDNKHKIKERLRLNITEKEITLEYKHIYRLPREAVQFLSERFSWPDRTQPWATCPVSISDPALRRRLNFWDPFWQQLHYGFIRTFHSYSLWYYNLVSLSSIQTTIFTEKVIISRSTTVFSNRK